MKVGNDFKIDEKYKDAQIIDIGGYKIIISVNEGVWIQGIQLMSLFELPIGIAGILPLNETAMRVIKDFPFDIEKNHLVYQVSYCEKAWYFNKKQDAFLLLDLILQIKEHALHQEFINKHIAICKITNF